METPQSGTVASEDCPPPVTWSPSSKVSTGSLTCRSALKSIFHIALCRCHLPEHSNCFQPSADGDSVCLEPDSLSHSGGDDLPEGMQYSIWVSFYEIYNEFVYDLLDVPHSLSLKKRVTLRLSDDRHGNPYVKGEHAAARVCTGCSQESNLFLSPFVQPDLTWIQVRSAEEAWRLLRAGQRNQSFASTHLNQNSSRRWGHTTFCSCENKWSR